ncbi:hypothetical protein V8D89_013385 [Ganoderma adspersum]
MQANPYNSQQSSSGGRQQKRAPTSWSGYGKSYKVVVGDVVYVGVALESLESTGGECYRLQFLYGQTRNIQSERCQRTSAAMTVAPPIEAIPNVLQETEPVYADFPGAMCTRGRPYLKE